LLDAIATNANVLADAAEQAATKVRQLTSDPDSAE
jgi:hypothetical protein